MVNESRKSGRATAGVWTGRVLSGLLVLFLLMDGGMKIAKIEPVMKASAELGIPANAVVGIGATLVVCTLLYALPATAVLGAILLTGYLGGAVMTHVRVFAEGGPAGGVFPVVFSSLFGVLLWVGLYLREPRLRALVPLRAGRMVAQVPAEQERVLTGA